MSKVRDGFGLTRVVLVGDRGMLTAARLREDVGPAGLDWITALRAPQVRALVRDGALQLSLFDQMDLAEITSPDFPGERLVACKNPFLEPSGRSGNQAHRHRADGKNRRRGRAGCRPLRGTGKIALRADRVLRRRKVAKHFTTSIGDEHFSYARNQDSITAEAALDGIYVLRTSVEASGLDGSEVVASYKALAQVERAFRAFNTDLDIRPIRHRTETRVRAHVFLRMLSYYITWHMHARLAPLLFTDDDKAAAETARPSPVAPAGRSPRALAKAATKRTEGNLPVHSLTSLLAAWPPSASTRSSPPTRPCPASGSSPPPPPCSARPSTCSASATASGPRSHKPAPHRPETPGKRPNTRTTGRNFGLGMSPRSGRAPSGAARARGHRTPSRRCARSERQQPAWPAPGR